MVNYRSFEHTLNIITNDKIGYNPLEVKIWQSGNAQYAATYTTLK
jgi:hypothetical protein